MLVLLPGGQDRAGDVIVSGPPVERARYPRRLLIHKPANEVDRRAVTHSRSDQLCGQHGDAVVQVVAGEDVRNLLTPALCTLALAFGPRARIGLASVGRGCRFERRKGCVEVNLSIRVCLYDLAQPRLPLAMPGARPT